MPELNNTQSVMVTDEEGFDTLTVTNMGDAISLAQVAEDGTLHDTVIGREQARSLYAALQGFLAN